MIGSNGFGIPLSVGLRLDELSKQNKADAESARERSSSSSSANSNSGTKFFAGGESALASLISSLQNGGTEATKKASENRIREVNDVRSMRNDYSKANAFVDAEQAAAAEARRVMEDTLPALVSAAAGAGTSGSSMRALLTQEAAARAAETAGTMKLKAAVDYGSVAASLSNTLEALTRADEENARKGVDQLLQALAISKGEVSSSTQSSTSSSLGRRETSSGGGLGGLRPSMNIGDNSVGSANFDSFFSKNMTSSRGG